MQDRVEIASTYQIGSGLEIGALFLIANETRGEEFWCMFLCVCVFPFCLLTPNDTLLIAFIPVVGNISWLLANSDTGAGFRRLTCRRKAENSNQLILEGGPWTSEYARHAELMEWYGALIFLSRLKRKVLKVAGTRGLWTMGLFLLSLDKPVHRVLGKCFLF